MHFFGLAVSALLCVSGILADSQGAPDDVLVPGVFMSPFSNNTIQKRSQRALACWVQDDRYKNNPSEASDFTASCLTLKDNWFIFNDNQGEGFDLYPGITMEFVDNNWARPKCKVVIRNNSRYIRRTGLTYYDFGRELGQFFTYAENSNPPCPLGARGAMGGVFIWQQAGDTPMGQELYVSVQPNWIANPDWYLDEPWPNAHDHAK